MGIYRPSALPCMSMTQPYDKSSLLQMVKSLAQALDADDYEAARAVLAPDVSYEIGDEKLVGPDAVLASYRSASEMAQRLFPSVEYRHQVIGTVERTKYRVRYFDVLTAGEETHEHVAEQMVTVDPQLGVVRIVDTPVPGEREKLDEFMERHHITRESG